jgi:pimeloyl-ACP methyl ester carboxylesterase
MKPPAFAKLALATSLLFAVPAWAQPAAPDSPRMVEVGGHKLRLLVEGTVREGRPTVVLVGGLGDPLEVWKTVQPRIAGFARAVSYDRAGLGQSEPDGAPPTPRHIATQLHDLLHNAGINPPYVLVGHSIGGPHVRMFAGLYPGEVAGVVYVDPTDFTQTRADQLAIWTALGAGEAGLKAQEAQFEKNYEGSPPALRAEAEVSLQLARSGWEEFRSLAPLPSVPVVVLMATKIDMPQEVKVVIGAQRIPHLAKLAAEAADGVFVMTTRSGHYIHNEEPDLVVWAVRRALRAEAD